MKKLVLSFSIMSFLLFPACTAGQIRNYAAGTAELPVAQPSAVYHDGVYTGQGDPWQYGSEDAVVAIENGRIQAVTLRKLDENGNEVDYEQWVGDDRPNLKRDRITLANAILIHQTYEVDNILGSTISCVNWKQAVKRALEKAQND